MKRCCLQKFSALLAALVLLVAVAACGAPAESGASGDSDAGGQSAGASGEGTSDYKELTIYSSLPETELPVYFNAFTKDTGITVNYVRLAAGEALARVKAEASNPNAALMFGGSTENYIAAIEDGLLEAYQSPELANIPDVYKDPDGIWNPFYVGATCFAVNRDWFQKNDLDYPQTWDDLLRPEFRDQISLAHPSTSGTSYTILATIVQMRGEEAAWEYFAQLNDNVRQYTKSGAAPPMEVALGEAAIGVIFSHDALKPANEGYPIDIVFPADGTGYEIGAVALIKNAPQEERANAERFIDWILSQRGQECFIEAKSNRLPLNVKAKVSDGLKPIDEVKVIAYDDVWSGENRTRLIEEFTERIDNASSVKE